MKKETCLFVLLFLKHFQSGKSHLRHSLGRGGESKVKHTSESVEKLLKDKNFNIISEGLPHSNNAEVEGTRRLKGPCESQGEKIDGVEIK